MIKRIQICKSDNHNFGQCPSKLVGGRCPTKEIMLMHVVQIEAFTIFKKIDKTMKYLITKKDMEISHIIQGQIIKIGKAIEITNSIRIISLTNGFWPNNTRCFCCRKERHVRMNYHVWKKNLEDEAKNSTTKVGINVVMVD